MWSSAKGLKKSDESAAVLEVEGDGAGAETVKKKVKIGQDETAKF